jgi:ATP-dependent RNA helicase DeaD
VTWGGEQGADARRLLAMVCRRGEVQGSDVGSIRVARGFSTVEIASKVADEFAKAVAQPDPRNPRVYIKRDASTSQAGPERPQTTFLPSPRAKPAFHRNKRSGTDG